MFSTCFAFDLQVRQRSQQMNMLRRRCVFSHLLPFYFLIIKWLILYTVYKRRTASRPTSVLCVCIASNASSPPLHQEVHQSSYSNDPILCNPRSTTFPRFAGAHPSRKCDGLPSAENLPRRSGGDRPIRGEWQICNCRTSLSLYSEILHSTDAPSNDLYITNTLYTNAGVQHTYADQLEASNCRMCSCRTGKLHPPMSDKNGSVFETFVDYRPYPTMPGRHVPGVLLSDFSWHGLSRGSCTVTLVIPDPPLYTPPPPPASDVVGNQSSSPLSDAGRKQVHFAESETRIIFWKLSTEETEFELVYIYCIFAVIKIIFDWMYQIFRHIFIC